MNREQRRGAAKVAGSRTDKKRLRSGAVRVSDKACKLCAYIASTIVGSRHQDFRDKDGDLVELHVNERVWPPYGIRFPKDAAKRSKCLDCAGVGIVGCPDCKGKGEIINVLAEGKVTVCPNCQGKGKVPCLKCAGSGINWVLADYAPLCMLCSQFFMAWLQEREQLHTKKKSSPDSGRILLPNSQQRGTGSIILPGRG